MTNTMDQHMNHLLYKSGEIKRADQRSSITVLVLGDEGVGKSSLISSYVSRYFSEVVPGIMTRVRLPPDPSNSCVTTIVDSQCGDAALLQAINNKTTMSGGGGVGSSSTMRRSTATIPNNNNNNRNDNNNNNNNNNQQTAVSSEIASTGSLQALLERAELSLTAKAAAVSSSNISPAISDPPDTIAAKTTATTSTRPVQHTSGAAAAATTTTTFLGASVLSSASSSMSFLSSTNQNNNNSNANTIENVDSIVLVYDLDRVETFFRLENHWLPLIERCYNGKIPVIVAENKVDLFRPTSVSSSSSIAASATESAATTADEQALARKRQQLVSLMQRFPFIRQCIKCSAKNLLRVEDIFIKAQQAVLYPFSPPLYNLETGQLSTECERALRRIFRMFDKDYDFLLSDFELDRFQRDTYTYRIFERDMTAWKKVVSSNYAATLAEVPTVSGGPAALTPEPVLRDGSFTVAGFFAIFDVFITQNRLDVVWQALRKYGYDDDLNLHIPRSVIWPNYDSTTTGTVSLESSGMGSNKKQQLITMMRNWRLTSSSKEFLEKIFHQFDSDNDGMLSQDDMLSIFSILPPPSLPPWHPVRAPYLFEHCFSCPKQSLSVSGNASPPSGGSVSGSEASPTFSRDTKNNMGESTLIIPEASSPPMSQTTMISHGGLSIFSASDSLPSIDVGGMYPLSKSLSFLEWMGHWHAISAISPAVARMELYRLGHVEDYSTAKHKKSKNRLYGGKRKKKSAHQLRVLVVGSQSCGKTSLLNVLCGALDKKLSAMGSPVTVRATDTAPTKYPETSATYVKMKRKATISSSSPKSTVKTSSEVEGEDFAVHLVFTDVPEAVASEQLEDLAGLLGSNAATNIPAASSSPKNRGSVFDLVMLVFDSTNSSSFAFVKELESNLLTNDAPRVFIGTKVDQVVSPNQGGDARTKTVIDSAVLHCRESDLEPPLLTSAADVSSSFVANKSFANCTYVGTDERLFILDHLSRCALSNEPGIDLLKSRPHEEQKRKEASRRRTMMWFGGIVTVGVAVVAVGVGLLWSSSPSKSKEQKISGGGLSWLRSWFGGGNRSSARPAVAE